MKLAVLRERAAYWQARLNLREWNIKVTWGTKAEMGPSDFAPKGVEGFCSWSTEELTAKIQLNRKTPCPEAVLIHEMLHIVIDGHAAYEKYDEHTERAINRIAGALCNP